MAKAAKHEEAGGAADKPSALERVNPTWDLKLIIVACVVGALVVAIGVWAEIYVKLDAILSTTFMVSGLALIFGAFGAQATVRYKSLVIAGVAATALIFLFAIDYLRHQSIVIIDIWTPDKFVTTIKAGLARVKGTVEGNAPSMIQMRYYLQYAQLQDDPNVITAWPNPSGGEALEVPICVTRDKVLPWFGRGAVELQVKAASREDPNMEILNRKSGKQIGSRKDCDIPDPTVAGARNPVISSAHAEAAADIDRLIEDLLSDNTDVRRLARDRLAARGASVIRPLMNRAVAMTESNDRLAFRMQVGAAVVIDTMLSSKGRQVPPATVSQELNARDFAALVSWTLNNDLSLRDPAVRIVANTADIAALRLLMQAIGNQTDANVVFNTAWILLQSAQRLRSNASVLAEIKQFARQLRPRAHNDNTTRLLNQIEAL
jgi:hypothetical protein